MQEALIRQEEWLEKLSKMSLPKRSEYLEWCRKEREDVEQKRINKSIKKYSGH
ncbi:MAG: hypothetical protein AAB509_01005 [Patescibacteria group bacterium]